MSRGVSIEDSRLKPEEKRMALIKAIQYQGETRYLAFDIEFKTFLLFESSQKRPFVNNPQYIYFKDREKQSTEEETKEEQSQENCHGQKPEFFGCNSWIKPLFFTFVNVGSELFSLTLDAKEIKRSEEEKKSEESEANHRDLRQKTGISYRPADCKSKPRVTERPKEHLLINPVKFTLLPGN